MIRRPPKATRTETLLSDTTLFRSHVAAVPATAAFLDFLVHGARNEIARSQVLERGRIALHEALAVLVQQDAAFAAHAFGNQHARAGHAGGVELPEFEILQRQAGAGGHRSEERRVGKECVSTCRSRWSTYH